MNADSTAPAQDVTPAGDEWQTVSDTIGDEFIGEYIGSRLIESEDGKFTQFRFKVEDDVYFTNAGYSLLRGMSHVIKGQRVRVVFSSERDTGQESLMRIFRVDVA